MGSSFPSPRLYDVVEVRFSAREGRNLAIKEPLESFVAMLPSAVEIGRFSSVEDQIRYRESQGFRKVTQVIDDGGIKLVDSNGNYVSFQSRPAKIEVSIPDGIFTMAPEGEKDEYTFRIHTVKKGKLAGKRLISVHTGTNLLSDFTSEWTTLGFVFADNLLIWSKVSALPEGSKVLRSLKFAFELAKMDDALWLNSSKLYAQRSGRCFRCNKKLIRTGSLLKSCGPECEKKLRKSRPELFAGL